MSWTLRLILVAAIAAAFFGTYKAGEGQGINTGDKAGYKRGWDEQQVQVNKLTKTINDNNTANNKKISDLEGLANAKQAEINKLNMSIQYRVDEALATFKLEHAQIANSCGLAVEAVGTLRNLMGAKK